MARIYPKKSHCLNGHEKTPENTSSNYSCKLCSAMRDAARHPRITKACAWCSVEFLGRADQLYCNRSCLDKAKTRRKSKVTDERREELRLSQEKRSAWRLAHPGERWYAHKTMSPEEKQAFYRVEQLKESGWTMETFAAAKESQGGCCAICGDTPIPAAHCSEGLCADHKHVKPPMPRALLCHKCNSGIGYFLESPERCEAAAAYLRKWA